MGPVAQHAKKGAPNRKMMNRLSARLRDYEAMMGDPRTSSRVKSSAHRPGSFSK